MAEETFEDKIINEPTKVNRVVADKLPESKPHQFTDIELLLVVLVAVIIGMIIAALIRKVLDERNSRYDGAHHIPWFYPPPPYMRMHSREQRREVVPYDDSEERLSRKAALERTPGSYLKHGVYFDDEGEAVYDPDFSVYETWQVMRDARGRITDAVRMEE